MNPTSPPPTEKRGLRLGLTGVMGGGKSTATDIFRDLGFGVIDSDVLVRDLWEKDEIVKKVAVGRWGNRILRVPGAGSKEQVGQSTWNLPLVIDRRKVAEIVFGDAKELLWLEGLLHPWVRARWQTTLTAEPGRDWVVEIPLLFEKNLASEFDFTLCLWASPALQAARLAARGLSPVEIAARQARQWPLREKAERANLVALNDGTVDFLRQQIVYLAGRLRESAK